MKVLIISHNSLSSTSSIGKTLATLFYGFEKEELCQIYIHKTLPRDDICTSYYNFTDKDVLKGVFTRTVNGVEAKPDLSPQSADSGVLNAFTYGSSLKREPYMEILREFVWKISPWYNDRLKEWVSEQKPTCIFAAIGSGTFLYDIALKISKDFGIPIVTYICDDFYNMPKPKKIFGGLWKRNINKKTKELLHGSSAVAGICDGISETYGKEFGIKHYTVMTGTSFSVKSEVAPRREVKNICYFGKISLNRYFSLLDICKSLDRINEKLGTHYCLNIFCDKPNQKVLNEFTKTKSAVFRGFVTGKDFEREFFLSDALIFVEAFDKVSIDRVKNSVSTKIADSLASGIPLFAYAPADIAATRHLTDNNCAVVCSDKNKLEFELEQFLSGGEIRALICENALATAKKFHDPAAVSRKLYEAIENI